MTARYLLEWMAWHKSRMTGNVGARLAPVWDWTISSRMWDMLFMGSVCASFVTLAAFSVERAS